MTVRRHLGFLSVLPLYVAMAVAVGYVDHHVRPRATDSYTHVVPEILSGHADPPARYRVLAPLLVQGFTRVTGSQPENGWLVFRVLCLVAAFSTGHLLYRTWFSTGGAVAGNVMMAALLPLTFTDAKGHPDTFVELALFALGCACAVRGWRLRFLAVLAVATLNRETAFLLVVVYAGLEGLSAAALRRIALAGLTFALVYVGLRWSLGYVPYKAWNLDANIYSLFTWPVEAYQRDLYYRAYAWFLPILLSGPLVIIARTWQSQPRFVRAGAGLAVPLFAAIGVMFSSLMEPRIFTPLLPILSTGMLFAFFDPVGVSAPATSR